MKPFSIKKMIREGWEMTKSHLGLILGSAALYVLFAVFIPNMLARSFQETTSSAEAVFGTILFLIAWAVSVIVQIGFTKLFLKIHDGEHASLSDLFVQYRLFWKYFSTNVLYNLAVILPPFVVFIAGILLAATTRSSAVLVIAYALSALLVIPAVILSIRYGFAVFSSIDKELGPISSMKRSAVLTADRKWEIFKFYLVLIGLNILGVMALGIGLILTIPVSFLATIGLYRTLEKLSGSTKSTASEPVIEA